MSNIIFTIQFPKRLLFEEENSPSSEEERPLLFPAFATWQYPINNILPAEEQERLVSESSLADPKTLVLAYEENNNRFFVALPDFVEIPEANTSTNVQLRYEQITGERGQAVVFQWNARITSRAKIITILEGQVENAVLLIVNPENPAVVAPHAVNNCRRRGCVRCEQLSPSRWLACKQLGCCY